MNEQANGNHTHHFQSAEPDAYDRAYGQALVIERVKGGPDGA